MISSTTCTVNRPGIYNFVPLDLSKERRHIDQWRVDLSKGRRQLDGWRVPYPFKGEEAFGRVEDTIPLDLSKGRRHLDEWRVPYP